MPYDPKELSPEEFAKTISVTTTPDGSTEACIKLLGKNTTILLGEKNWDVKRTQ